MFGKLPPHHHHHEDEYMNEEKEPLIDIGSFKLKYWYAISNFLSSRSESPLISPLSLINQEKISQFETDLKLEEFDDSFLLNDIVRNPQSVLQASLRSATATGNDEDDLTKSISENIDSNVDLSSPSSSVIGSTTAVSPANNNSSAIDESTNDLSGTIDNKIQLKLRELVKKIRESPLATIQSIRNAKLSSSSGLVNSSLSKITSLTSSSSSPSSSTSLKTTTGTSSSLNLSTSSTNRMLSNSSVSNYILTSFVPFFPVSQLSSQSSPLSQSFEILSNDSPEVLLTVSISQPHKMIKSQEFIVLGSNRLTELRERIYCIEDAIMQEELKKNKEESEQDISFSSSNYQNDQSECIIGKDEKISSSTCNFNICNTKKSSLNLLNKDIHRSARCIFDPGFFCIEGVFYNDSRNSQSEDYSTSFIQWLNEKKTQRDSRFFNKGPWLKKDMDSFTFDSLKIRLDTPYLYLHHGNCEHLLTFHSIRLYSSPSPPNADILGSQRLSYPRLIYQSRLRRLKCRICDINPASYITRSDRLSPENPSFWCESCYISFHYDRHTGKLLYDDFEVYSYIHE